MKVCSITYLSVLSSTQFVTRSHLQRKFGTNLHLCSQKFRPVPVMLNLLLDLLSDSQLLRLLLLLYLAFLRCLRHSNIVYPPLQLLRLEFYAIQLSQDRTGGRRLL